MATSASTVTGLAARAADDAGVGAPPPADEWSGPAGRRRRKPFRWSLVLWSLVYPQRVHRTVPTMLGVVLIALAFGIGTAAYNSSSNILFITLSLLLACLILSGVLSWFNLRGLAWRLRLSPPLRAGHDTVVALDLVNRKSFLPTYGLWFELTARAVRPQAEQRAESTWTGRGIDVRAVLAKADENVHQARVPLVTRLDSGAHGRVEWVMQPAERGLLRVELSAVGSLFPFGFLRKEVGVDLGRETVVWPAPIDYRRHAVATARRAPGGERVPRAGTGGDLLALRRYAPGDSHRLIHWKASARTGQLLVRQFAAETAEGYSLWLRTDAGAWPHPEQFEILIRLAATLAEDLFRVGRLQRVAIDVDPPVQVRRIRDLEAFLDRLAVLRPRDDVLAPAGDSLRQQNLVTFAPEGTRGVTAHIDGQVAASA